jgi:hypothetical protein
MLASASRLAYRPYAFCYAAWSSMRWLQIAKHGAPSPRFSTMQTVHLPRYLRFPGRRVGVWCGACGETHSHRHQQNEVSCLCHAVPDHLKSASTIVCAFGSTKTTAGEPSARFASISHPLQVCRTLLGLCHGNSIEHALRAKARQASCMEDAMSKAIQCSKSVPRVEIDQGARDARLRPQQPLPRKPVSHFHARGTARRREFDHGRC